MGKTIPVRISTFMVPLAGVALYYYIQFAALSICSLLFSEKGTREILSKHFGSFYMIVSGLMGLCLIAWLFFARNTIWKTIQKDRLPVKIYLTAIPLALAMLGFSNLYMIGLQELSQYFVYLQDLLKQYLQNISLANSLSGSEAAGYYIAVGILIPIIEEIIFRGIILGVFHSTMKAKTSVFWAALIFSAMHLDPVQIGYAFVCGLILGFAYIYSNSLYLPISIHILFNLLGGILPAAFAGNQPLLSILGITEICCIAAGVFFFLYLRKNFRPNIVGGE